MIEAGWPARQVGRYDLTVRRCWDQWTEETSFTRRPGSGRPRQTSSREYRHIIRHACVEPTASLAAVETQHLHYGPLCLPEPSQGAYLFNLSSDDNRVRVWRPRGARLNSVLALHRRTAPPAGGTIAYDTRSPHILIHGTIRTQQYIHDILRPHVLPLMAGLPGAIFSTRQCSTTHSKDITRLPLHCYYPFLACSIPRFVTNRTYLRSFEATRWTAYEFGRTKGAFTTTVECDVSEHHTKLECINASSHCTVHSC
ncbi:transposable element Tcb2 transposase [Trichonephila clavipes]|nr:transposable element Tcb2 transposase [Trichonephila clavipes]